MSILSEYVSFEKQDRHVDNYHRTATVLHRVYANLAENDKLIKKDFRSHQIQTKIMLNFDFLDHFSQSHINEPQDISTID